MTEFCEYSSCSLESLWLTYLSQKQICCPCVKSLKISFQLELKKISFPTSVSYQTSFASHLVLPVTSVAVSATQSGVRTLGTDVRWKLEGHDQHPHTWRVLSQHIMSRSVCVLTYLIQTCRLHSSAYLRM